jgi:hypothetical protein
LLIAPIAAPAPGPNTPPPPAHNGPAFCIKVQAQADGTFDQRTQWLRKDLRAEGRDELSGAPLLPPPPLDALRNYPKGAEKRPPSIAGPDGIYAMDPVRAAMLPDL